MEWMKERDLLIAETMEFVQSLAGGKPGLGPPSGSEPGGAAAPVQAPIIQADESLEPSKAIQPGVRLPRAIVGSDVRAEIQTRLANFRAHQERFHREREEFFSATLARARAAIGSAADSPGGLMVRDARKTRSSP
jgi:hypothetical protein